MVLFYFHFLFYLKFRSQIRNVNDYYYTIIIVVVDTGSSWNSLKSEPVEKNRFPFGRNWSFRSLQLLCYCVKYMIQSERHTTCLRSLYSIEFLNVRFRSFRLPTNNYIIVGRENIIFNVLGESWPCFCIIFRNHPHILLHLFPPLSVISVPIQFCYNILFFGRNNIMVFECVFGVLCSHCCCSRAAGVP